LHNPGSKRRAVCGFADEVRSGREEAVMATVSVKSHIANWFEIPVNDLDRAAKFYEKVFDVKLSREDMGGMKMAMFPFTQDAPGAAGTLVKGESYVPSHAGTVVYFSVEDIPETLRKINANGGKTLMPKTAIGEYGFIAQFEDIEGNRLALHSRK
jgi:predicted enzyme related to lactoylglutathione lyase